MACDEYFLQRMGQGAVAGCLYEVMCELNEMWRFDVLSITEKQLTNQYASAF